MFFRILSLLVLVAVGAACHKKPEYPATPKITLEGIDQFYNATYQGDSLVAHISFQDGDGDLGIEQAEREPPSPLNPKNANKPFQEFFYTFDSAGNVVTKQENKFYYNLFINVYKKNAQTGLYEPYNFALPLNYAFPPLYEGTRRSAMEGTIRHHLINFLGGFFQKGEQYKFEFQIADRNLNLSNIVSKEITLNMTP